MLEYLILGGGFAFASAVQPGPLLAFLFAQVAERGWRVTLPAAASPLLTDGPIAVLVLLLLRELPTDMQRLLRGAGGILLLYLAWTALRRWRQRAKQPATAEGGSARGPLLRAALVNAANPAPYLGWSLVLGPAALEAWAHAPSYAVALVGAFYGVMTVTLALIILLFGTTQFLASAGRRVVTLVSALALAALGFYQLWVSVRG